MAIHREQEYCPRCGNPLKAIHNDMGENFVGNTFSHWAECKCQSTTPRPTGEPGKEGGEMAKVIERLVDLKKYHINPYNLGDMGEVGKLIDQLAGLAASTGKAEGWISVEEENEPPHNRTVLLYVPLYQNTVTGRYDRNSNEWYRDSQSVIGEVTHWMPLPANPIEVKQ